MAQALGRDRAPTLRWASSIRSRAAAPSWIAAHVTPRALLVGGLTTTAALLVTGVLQVAGVTSIPGLDLNGEQNLPAAVTAALLLFAGCAAFLWTDARGPSAVGFRSGQALALVLAFMGLDEFGQLHEKAERLTGIDWQLLYVPVMAFAAIAALGTLRALAGAAVCRQLLVVGGTGWVGAGLLEILEYDGGDRRVAGFEVMVLLEEHLELLGSLAFALAMLVALRRAALVRTLTRPTSCTT